MCRPEKIRIVNKPLLKAGSPAPGGLGVVGLDGIGVVERDPGAPPFSFASFASVGGMSIILNKYQ